MNVKHLFLLAALGAVATFASCSNDDEVTDNNPVAVRFTSAVALPDAAQAGVKQSPVTRAAGNTWALNDPIGIFMVDHGTTTTTEGAANRLYKASAGGVSSDFTADAADAIYYPMDGSKVDFIAYYPHDVAYLTLSTTYNVNVATQADPTKIDLLWAKANNVAAGYDKTYTGNVALAFGHKLSRLAINCWADANVGATLTDMVVSVKGLKTTGTFDLSTGGPAIATGTGGTFAPHTVTNGSVYDAIILPATYATGDVTVEFKLTTGETFTWDVEGKTFEPGKQYAYDVTLTRTGVKATGTISPWTVVSEPPVTAQ